MKKEDLLQRKLFSLATLRNVFVQNILILSMCNGYEFGLQKKENNFVHSLWSFQGQELLLRTQREVLKKRE